MSEYTALPGLLATERARLDKDLEILQVEQRGLEERMTQLYREIAAIDAYETALLGRVSVNPAPAARRPRNNSQRGALLQLVGESQRGYTRGELLERLGYKGDKQAEMSVSNALTGLIKSGQLCRENRRYLIGTASSSPRRRSR